MAGQDAIDSGNYGSWHGTSGWVTDVFGVIFDKRAIPEFDDPWEGKVTDSQLRIDLPIFGWFILLFIICFLYRVGIND